MAELGSMIVRVGADLTDFSVGMERVRTTLDTARTKIEETGSATQSFGERFTALSGKLLGAGAALSSAVTAPIIGLGAASITTAAQLEQAKIGFETMLGSAERAGSFLEQLRQFALTTPFQFPELVTASQRMMALGFSAEQVIPTLRIIGDASAALGGSAETLNRIIVAIGQMQAKGTVAAEEMRQLAEAGIPAWEILAKSIGVSIPEAMELVRKKAVDASQAVPAILAGMNEKFGGMMQRQTQTVIGQWSNLKDQITFTLTEIGTALLPLAQSALRAFQPVLEVITWLARGFTSLPAPIQTVLVAIAALAAAIGPLLLAIGGVAAALPAITAALPLLGAAFAAVTGPVGLVTAALAALGVWIAANWEPIKAVLLTTWDAIKEVWGAVWSGVRAILEAHWNALRGAAEAIWGGIRTIAGAIWGAIGETVTSVWAPVDSALRRAWNSIASFLSGLWDELWKAAKRAWEGIVDAMRSFLRWAEANIPGVKKLLSLDDAWKSAKQYEEQTKRVDNAVRTTTASMRAMEGGTKLLTASTDRARASLASTEAATNGLRAATQAFATSDSLRRLEQQWFGVFEAAERVRAQGMDAIFRRWQEEAIKTVPELRNVGTEIKNLRSDLGVFGAQSQAVFDASLQGIRQFGNALPELPAGLKRAMDESFDHISRRTKATVDEQSGLWTTLNRQVSTIVTDLGKGIADVILSGKSLQEVFVDALKEIGNAVIRLVTEQIAGMLVRALRDLITGHLPDLVGAFKKAIGAIIDLFGDLGKSVSNVTGQVAGAGQAAGGAAGGAAPGAAAGGAAGWIGAITGIVSAVTDVFGLFGQRRMEQDIARIEISIRGILHQLIALQHSANEWWPWMREATDVLWKIYGAVGGAASSLGAAAIEAASDAMEGLRAKISSLADAAAEHLRAIRELTEEAEGVIDIARSATSALRGLADAADFVTDRLRDAVATTSSAIIAAGDRLTAATKRSVDAIAAAAQSAAQNVRAQSGPITIRFEGFSSRDQEFAQYVIEQFIRQAKATGQLV